MNGITMPNGKRNERISYRLQCKSTAMKLILETFSPFQPMKVAIAILDMKERDQFSS